MGFLATVFFTAGFLTTGFFVTVFFVDLAVGLGVAFFVVLAVGLGVGFVVAAHEVPIEAIIAPATIIESTRPFILDSI